MRSIGDELVESLDLALSQGSGQVTHFVNCITLWICIINPLKSEFS